METKTIAVDFGRSDIYSKIEEGLAGLEIGVLGKKSFVCRATNRRRRWRRCVEGEELPVPKRRP